VAEGGGDWPAVPKADVRWKLLIRVPEFVNTRDLTAALKSLRAKRRDIDDAKLGNAA